VEGVEYFWLPLPASFFKVFPLSQKFNRFYRFHIPALIINIPPVFSYFKTKFLKNAAF